MWLLLCPLSEGQIAQFSREKVTEAISVTVARHFFKSYNALGLFTEAKGWGKVGESVEIIKDDFSYGFPDMEVLRLLLRPVSILITLALSHPLTPVYCRRVCINFSWLFLSPRFYFKNLCKYYSMKTCNNLSARQPFHLALDKFVIITYNNIGQVASSKALHKPGMKDQALSVGYTGLLAMETGIFANVQRFSKSIYPRHTGPSLNKPTQISNLSSAVDRAHVSLLKLLHSYLGNYVYIRCLLFGYSEGAMDLYLYVARDQSKDEFETSKSQRST